jgi:alkylation response protein AidB-like acyl-CoA dehydrogenase
MDFELTSAQNALYDEVLALARTIAGANIAESDAQGVFARECWQECGKHKLQGLSVPEQLGGRGVDSLSTALALEALGYGCLDAGLVFGVGAHFATSTLPIWKFGSAGQQERYLRRLCDGSLIGIGALTEPEAGSDAFSMQTTVRQDGTGFVLSGTKRFISIAPIADLVIIYAVTDRDRGFQGGMTAFIVEKGTPGFEITRVLKPGGLRTTPLGEITMREVRLPAEAVLGKVGVGGAVFNMAMDWERTLLMASHVGTMQRLTESAIRQARARKQFGQAIGKFQAVAHRLVDARVACEAARLLVYKAAHELERSKAASMNASMAKLFTSEAYVNTALDALRTFGAAGYMSGSETERALRDAVGSTIYSGTSDIQRNIIARWLGLL